MGEALTEEVAKGRQVEEALSLLDAENGMKMVQLLRDVEVGSARLLVKPC